MGICYKYRSKIDMSTMYTAVQLAVLYLSCWKVYAMCMVCWNWLTRLASKGLTMKWLHTEFTCVRSTILWLASLDKSPDILLSRSQLYMYIFRLSRVYTGFLLYSTTKFIGYYCKVLMISNHSPLGSRRILPPQPVWPINVYLCQIDLLDDVSPVYIVL